jgi:predicted dehydrogenase
MEDPDYAQGFRTILATEAVHPYMSNWWPPGHTIGYEHEHVHAVVDFLKAIDSRTEIRPNLEDGLKATRVLEAGLESARLGKRVLVSEVR